MRDLFKKLIPLLVALPLAGCAHRSFDLPAEPHALRRGWNFIEDERELVTQETGSPDINFTSGVLLGNRLIYGSVRFGLMVLNKDTGRVYWRKKFPGGVISNLAVAENRIFFGSQDGFFHCVNADSGEDVWKSSIGFPAVGTPAVAQGRILVGSVDRAVHALDIATGKELWAFRRGASGTTTIKGGGNAVFFGGKFWVGFSDGTLVALDPNDGAASVERQFQDNPKFSDITATPVPWKRGLLVSTYDGKIRFLNPDGSLVWTFPAGGAHSPIPTAIQGGTIYAAASDGYVYAFQDGTAKQLWRFGLKGGIPTGILVVPNGDKFSLVVASSDNFIYVLDALSGKLLAMDSLGSSSGTYADLIQDTKNEGNFFLVSHYGRIFQFLLTR